MVILDLAVTFWMVIISTRASSIEKLSSPVKDRQDRKPFTQVFNTVCCVETRAPEPGGNRSLIYIRRPPYFPTPHLAALSKRDTIGSWNLPPMTTTHL